MSLELIQYLFDLGIKLFVVLLFVFLLIFINHLLIPRELLKTYFKQPYFKQAEIIFFTGFPFGYIRTVMFMRLVSSPLSGKKRGLTEAYKLAPNWYIWLSKITLLLFMVVFGLFMSIMLIFIFEFFIIHPELHKNL